MFSKLIFRLGTVLPLLLTSATVGSGMVVWEMLFKTAPAIAQTTLTTTMLIEPSEEESYDVFIARAEANAEVKVQELFDKDLLRTEVRLTVLGQKSAAIAPVLKLRVSRREWTSYPDPEIWSLYYPEAKFLLNFYEEPAPEAEPEPDTESSSDMMEETPLFTPSPADNDDIMDEAIDNELEEELREIELEEALDTEVEVEIEQGMEDIEIENATDLENIEVEEVAPRRIIDLDNLQDSDAGTPIN
ncbi:MAG: hypothetical protein WBB82_06650 [Limnothrix sp.]